MKKLLLPVLCIFYLMVSCKDDDLQMQSQNEMRITASKGISINGTTLAFSSEELFKQYYNSLSSMEEDALANELFLKFYENGFSSAIPIVTDETLSKIKNQKIVDPLSNQMSSKLNLKSENVGMAASYDNIDELLGDEVFASLLDPEGNLIIEDILYKYTFSGMFKTKLANKNKLYDYLKSQGISTSLYRITPIEITQNYINNNNSSGGMVNFTDNSSGINIEFFIKERGNDPYLRKNVDNDLSIPETDRNGFDLGEIASNLDVCSIKKPWFGNIFGTVKVCIDKYQDRRRVKSKFYDIDLFLAYAMGYKVKHQKRGWTSLWRRENTSYVALGLNSITYKWDYNDSWEQVNNIGSYANARMYFHNDTAYETLDSYYNAVNLGNVPMPKIPFASGFVEDLAFVIEIGGYSNVQNVSEEDLTKFFYSNLYNQAKSILNGISNSNDKSKGIVIFRGPSGTAIQIYDLSNICNNCSKREVILDWGIVSPQFTYNFGSGSETGLSDTSYNYDFRNPKVISLSAYGMAQRNSVWHGSRMKF